MFFLLPTVFLLSITVTACSSTPDAPAPDTQALSETDEQIFVGDTIEMNYDPNVIMKRAESYFEKESYAEAVVEYNHFLDLHRSHILAPYAQHKIAMSHFKMFKTVDRDPAPIKKSLEAFQTLLSEFPGSRYEIEARENIKKCHNYIAQHNLLVGEFYYRKESYLAAAYRFESIIKEYPQLKIAGDAMYQLAQSYEKLGANEWAVDWLVKWAKKYPDNKHRQNGITLLAKLQGEDPDTLLARLNSPPTPKTIPVSVAQNGEPTHVQNGESSPIPASPPIIRVSTQPPSVAGQNGHSSPVPNTTVPSTACAIGAWCEKEALSSNTMAHNSETLNGHAHPINSTATPSASCSLGSWCETTTTITHQPAPAITDSPPTHTTQCQVGQWCSKTS